MLMCNIKLHDLLWRVQTVSMASKRMGNATHKLPGLCPEFRTGSSKWVRVFGVLSQGELLVLFSGILP